MISTSLILILLLLPIRAISSSSSSSSSDNRNLNLISNIRHGEQQRKHSPSISSSSSSSSSSYMVLIDRYTHKNNYNPDVQYISRSMNRNWNRNWNRNRNRNIRGNFNTAQIVHLPSEQALSKFLLTYPSTTSKSNPRKRNYHIKATLLSLLFFFALSQKLTYNNGTNNPLYIPQTPIRWEWQHVGLLYFFYILEAIFNSSTRKYISWIFSPNMFQTFLQKCIHQSKPWIVWTLQCFHYQRHHGHSHFDSNSHTVTRSTSMTSQEEKVITHRAQSHFQFHRWNNDNLFITSNNPSLSSSSSTSALSFMTVESLLEQLGIETNSQSHGESKENNLKETDVLNNIHDEHDVNHLKRRMLPFVKVKLTKMLILKGRPTNFNGYESTNNNALQNYILQKSWLEQMEGGRDIYTEILTSVYLDDFRSNLLVDRRENYVPLSSLHSEGGEPEKEKQSQSQILSTDASTPSTFMPVDSVVPTTNNNSLLYSFWIWTLLGFTVPFRIWFDSKCDDTVGIVIIKEILD